MPVLTDVEQDYIPSPRISVVLAPRTEYLAQDVVETTRKFEDSFRGMSEFKLVNASGKEDIGGGSFVGITYQFQDNQVQFEDRQTPAETGTITTGSVAPVGGKILVVDAAADFVSAAVKRGSFIVNWDDQSIVSINDVVDLNTLRVKVPTSGIGNTYDISDNYSVFNVVKCNLGGGNATAVDDLASAIDPAVPSVGVFLTLEKSVSAGLVSGSGSAADFWDALRVDHVVAGSFGEWVGNKLLTIAKFIALK